MTAGFLELQSSPIEGLGVFAIRPFQTGETILEIDDSRVVDQLHPLIAGDDARHCDYLAGGRVVLMQSPERHINHSCDPNAFVRTVAGRRLVIALRDIAAREEVTYDYCINGSGNTVWTCRCGASRCRREIHSDFFHLPLELQVEYLPLLDDWFREERAADVARCRNL
ncbi:MAG TPA: SET domain-containing protein-lysine N-methyltransferase [Bryobacteraceae bacterium]|nr:SET domain-containing protein-lysine N-methyltransferase [Bryobacteraceae bacterium]